MADLDKVVSSIRACIISSPSAVAAADLNRDYRILMGESIPFRKLGYSTLEEFLRSVKDIDVQFSGGSYYVKVKATAESGHISSLVRGQKKAKKPKRSRFSKFSSYSSSQRSSSNSYNYNRYKKRDQVPHFMQTSYSPPRNWNRYDPQGMNGTGSYSKADTWSKQTNFSSSTDFDSKESWQPTPSYSQPLKPSTKPQSSDSSSPPSTNGKNSTPPPVETQPRRNIAGSVANRPSQGSFKPAQPVPVTAEPAKVPTQPAKVPAQTTKVPTQSAKVPTQSAKVPTQSAKVPTQSAKVSARTPETSSVALRLLKYKRNQDTSSSMETHSQQHRAVPIQQSQPVKSEPANVTFIDPVKFNQRFANASDQSAEINRLEQSFEEESYVRKLGNYAEAQNWPRPNFFVLTRKIGSKRRIENRYIGRVIVITKQITDDTPIDESNSFEFSGYPHESINVKDALGVVAEKAYKSLLNQSAILLPETTDPNLVLKRVNQIVEGKEHGMWSHQVEKIYREKFYESLPADVAVLLERSSMFAVSKLTPTQFTVRPKITGLSSSVSGHYANSLTIPKVDYPGDDEWPVFVSTIKSTNEFYVRIIGEQYSDQYEALQSEMEKYFMGPDANDELAFDITIGKHYAFVTPAYCFRALVTDFKDNLYQIYLIDLGEVDFVPASALRFLLPQHYLLPAQAILCFLDGLDEYDFVPVHAGLQKSLCDNVLGKSFVSQVLSRDPVFLVLLDTSGDEPVNTNLYIKSEVEKSFEAPAFEEIGTLKEINVSVVDDVGQVFIQMPSWSLDCLKIKMDLISNGCYKMSHASNLNDIVVGNQYVYSNGPARVRVLKVSEDEAVEIQFIDTGSRLEVHFSELCLVKSLSKLLRKIPPQALPVLLHGIHGGLLAPSEAKKFLDMVQFNSETPSIAKVISYCDHVPEIEIFVRSPKDRLIVSINQNLMMPESCASSCINDDVSVSNMSIVSQAEAAVHKGVTDVQVNEEIEIFVSQVASPDNFTVTLVKYLTPLLTLHKEMLIYYSNTFEDYSPRIGEIVAALKDDSWHRVRIEKHIGNDLFFGTYMDRGYMDTFHSKNIRILADHFKKLSFLAYNAKLHGIKPVHGDWSVSDVFHMKNLMLERKLVAIVKDIIKERHTKKLSLEVIDTSVEFQQDVSVRLFNSCHFYCQTQAEISFWQKPTNA
ncbi:Tudor domain [Nesidiocoris tenuis]|uniref:Tudor domain n=1 Tax=Nesidiocoris tenuis TaxID=355587 RepID=A0ABN7AUG4_9HEMI|nr:Tudor domain [Nesidiocoris tenuis]